MDAEQQQLAEELFFGEDIKPSFAKKLFFGQFDAHRVNPFPKISESEQTELATVLKKLNALMDDKLDADAIDRNAEIPQDLIDGLGDLGILGISIPKEHGGLGMSQHSYCKAVEEISRRCASTALFVNAHQSIGLKALVLFGSPEQQEKYLPDLASGRKLAAFSLTEPNAGSDAAGVQTRAVYDPEKRVYRISGKKQWTTNGAIAEVLTVMAQTEVDGKDKITAFIVTPDMPGFRVRNPALEKVGMRGTKTANLEFDNVEVPEENVLGPLGKGLKVCLTVLDYGRTTFGASCTGAAKYCLARAIDHAKNRYQFKKPLAHFPLIKAKLARMAALVQAMDAGTYLTAGLLDGGQEDIMLESAIIKVYNSEALWEIIYETMQIFGGRSFFTDEPFERMMRDARLNMIGEGANEVMRAFIGGVGMRDVGMNLKDGVDALKNPFGHWDAVWSFTKEALGKFRKPLVELKSPQLAFEAEQMSRCLRQLGLAIPRLLAKYREQIVDAQFQLNRIGEAIMALFMATAVLTELDTRLQRKEPVGIDLSCGKYYCQIAFQEIQSALAGLNKNNDKQIEALSDQLTGLYS